MKQKLLFGFWIFSFPLLYYSSGTIVNLKHKFSLGKKVIACTGYIGITACCYVYQKTMN